MHQSGVFPTVKKKTPEILFILPISWIHWKVYEIWLVVLVDWKLIRTLRFHWKQRCFISVDRLIKENHHQSLDQWEVPYQVPHKTVWNVMPRNLRLDEVQLVREAPIQVQNLLTLWIVCSKGFLLIMIWQALTHSW